MDKKGCQFFLCDDLLVNKVNNLKQANKQTTKKKKQSQTSVCIFLPASWWNGPITNVLIMYLSDAEVEAPILLPPDAKN